MNGSKSSSNLVNNKPKTPINQRLQTETIKLLTSSNKLEQVEVKKKPTRTFFTEERYVNNGNPDSSNTEIDQWRMKGRMKTVCVALVLALNIGVDPPDIMKPEPCARMECWLDPKTITGGKALETIGNALQAQYERWQPRARYKQCLDPIVEDVKKLCTSLRRNAKEERVLFHYNGRGVPKPTNNGEIWVFNKNFTQYIPLSIYDLDSWMGTPSIYVFDCSSAGLVIKWFRDFTNQRKQNNQKQTTDDCILLAACQAGEILPMNPDLPADIFTSCLTTPIKMALHWFCSRTVLTGVSTDMIDKIPGRLNDRRTPLGELNWIFTAITDTIAWNVLPSSLFQSLFRQDLLVASLMRNFLLAERIMRSCNCNPISSPKLPSTHQHPLWHAWDLVTDFCLAQLPVIIDNPKEFKSSNFFSDQLTAFEVWLEFGSNKKKKPEQLPIVLQVLLSKSHRLRALQLLSKFLDLGVWAVNLALSVGIFPYVLKLLQSPSNELNEVLVFIWTKLLAVDRSCQADVIKDGGHLYFINIISNTKIPSDQRSMAAFIVSSIVDNYQAGQSACLHGNLLSACLNQLNDSDALVRRWVIICLAKLWENFEEAKSIAERECAHERLCALLTDPAPEVRAASIYALGTFIGAPEGNERRQNIEINIGLTLPVVTADMSPLARKELIIALGNLIFAYEDRFLDVILEITKEELKQKDEGGRLTSSSSSAINSNNTFNRSKNLSKTPPKSSSGTSPSNSIADSMTNQRVIQKQPTSVYTCLYRVMLSLRNDPYPELAQLANRIVGIIYYKLSNRVQHTKEPQLYNLLLRKSAIFQSSFTDTLSSSQFNNNNNTSSRSNFGDSKFQAQKKRSANNTRTLTRSLSNLPTYSDNPTPPLIPPKSVFYQWNIKMFANPIMFGSKLEDDPTSLESLERDWRHRRKERFLDAVLKRRDHARIRKLETQIAILDNEADVASLILLHPSESICVVTDERDIISVWNWEDNNVKLNMFRNGNPNGTHISSSALVNTHQQSLLMVGSDDGVVKLWRNYETNEELVTSWRALTDLHPNQSRHRGAGLVFNWNQDDGWLFTSGDVPIIRVWDVERSLSIQDIPSGSDTSCITSLAHHPGGSRMIVAGCGDGTVRVFDCRTPPKYTPAQNFSEHKGWVLRADMQVGGDIYQIISGAATGEVKFWDVRRSNSSKTFQTNQNGMTAFAVHSYAQIFSTGTPNQKVTVFNFEGKELSSIRYHDGFLGQRIGPISSLAFHPIQLILAAGATDSIISIYQSSVYTNEHGV